MPHKVVILLVFANDKNQPLDEIGKESQAIRKILRDHLDTHPHFHIELLPYSSAEDLFDELRRFNHQTIILHFAGHTNSELWKLHQGVVNANGMAEILNLQQSVHLLFLNGCSNQQQVAAFANAGIPTVIATNEPINDQQAQVFAIEFYKKLSSGKALKTSLQTAFNWAKATASAIGEKRSNRSLVIEDLDSSKEIEWSWGLIETQQNAAQWSLSDVKISPIISEELAEFKAIELKKRWDRLTNKISLMQEAYDNETRIEEQLRTEPMIEKLITDREQVEKEMKGR